jgi:hypothetical protein
MYGAPIHVRGMSPRVISEAVEREGASVDVSVSINKQ